MDFEKPIIELEDKIEDLRHLSDDKINLSEEVVRLQAKVERQLRQTYERLTPAQKVQVARHPSRPHFLDYRAALIDEFVPLAGDRRFAEDQAILCGLGRFRGRSVAVIGQEKGHDTETRIKHNFGMAKPEGYRKAQRVMGLADRYRLPILTFIDTAGAYPGVASEERGQAEAIARSIELGLSVTVPVVAVVIGEGGSGGAIALGTADRVLMLEHAIYSVISPEGCASILWRSGAHAKEAAAALKLTATDLAELGVIDEVVPEPIGGAHRFPDQVITTVGDRIEAALSALADRDGPSLRQARRDKFLAMGPEQI